MKAEIGGDVNKDDFQGIGNVIFNQKYINIAIHGRLYHDFRCAMNYGYNGSI